MIEDATHKIVDALLTLNFRLGLWPWQVFLCRYRLPIRWLWANTVPKPLDYPRCNTQDCWRAVDSPLILCWCSVDGLLTHCWRSSSGEATSRLTIVSIKAANTSIMDNSRSTGLRLYKMQHWKYLMLCCQSVDALLTVCWRSVDALLTLCWHYVDAMLTLIVQCRDNNINYIANKVGQYIDYRSTL